MPADSQVLSQAVRGAGVQIYECARDPKDGSKVVGEVVAARDAPAADAIPWLLLRAKSHGGAGSFGDTAFIQRLHTSGGRPPADGCDEAHRGQDARIPYQADYYFYAPRR